MESYPPTAEELKKHDVGGFDVKGIYNATLVYDGTDQPILYRAVPGSVLEPFYLYLTGAIERIHLDRISQYKKDHPGFKGIYSVSKTIPMPTYEFNERTAQKVLEPYQSSNVGIVTGLGDYPMIFSSTVY